MALTPGSDGREYTVSELQDLIAAKDADLAGTVSNAGQLPSGWTAGTDSQAAWARDWTTMMGRYNSARDAAERHIAEAPAIALLSFGTESASEVDATKEYDAVLVALNPSWPGAWGPGSFNDLSQRLQAAFSATGQTWTPYSVPQPGSDSGLNPNSWEAYVTGAAYKLGLIDKSKMPPGTPGGPNPGDPPLVPTWFKWVAGGGFVAWGAVQVKSLLK